MKDKLKIVHKLSLAGSLWQSATKFMKLYFTALLFSSAVFFISSFSGCASQSQPLVLAPVGPPVEKGEIQAAAQGTLLVYSAFETGLPGGNVSEGTLLHTSYELQSENGVLLQTIPNRTGYQGEDASPVQLAPGNYRVVARANGYGLVTIPVVIMADKVTVIHLEGGASWPDKEIQTAANRVTLPDGQIIGWKAQKSEKPATEIR